MFMYKYIALLLILTTLSINIAYAKDQKIETIKNEKINMVYQLKLLKKNILSLKYDNYRKAEKYAIDGSAISLNFSNIDKNLLKFSNFLITWNRNVGIKKLKSETNLFLKNN